RKRPRKRVESVRGRRHPLYRKHITPEFLIRAARRMARKHKGILTRKRFLEEMGIGPDIVGSRFPEGGWTQLQEAAGLPRHPHNARAVSEKQILEEFHRVARAMKAIPTAYQFHARAAFSKEVLEKRFGGMRGFLMRYREWLEARCTKSPLLE